MKKKKETVTDRRKKKKDIPGYPLYPSKEDIYNKGKREDDINPDDNSKIKEEKPGEENDKKLTGEDLDVPGSELDDREEEIGEEDEENNYYSLGGDKHD